MGHTEVGHTQGPDTKIYEGPDTKIYECCKCSSNTRLADEATLLERKACPIHGEAWHVEMLPSTSGSLKIAFPSAPLSVQPWMGASKLVSNAGARYCPEKYRLLSQYSDAVMRWSYVLGKQLAAVGFDTQYVRLKAETQAAAEEKDEAKAAYERHIAEHGCRGAGGMRSIAR